MTDLAQAVLPLIRTRTDLHRLGAANQHGRQMHVAVDILEAAIPSADPAEVYLVMHKALASAVKVVARADDSGGVIGHVCRRLLDLHPQVIAAARVPAGRVVDWLIKFQFDGDVDFFTVDPVAYAPALGEKGMASYRARLAEIEAGLGPRASGKDLWPSHRHEWFMLDWNAQRLAVFDKDVEEIIRTHARDRKVAAWLEDTAEAFDEIGEIDLALDWARQAADLESGHQSLHAGEYWCRLVEQHKPDEALDARRLVFRRWPSATTAAKLYAAASADWPEYREEVIAMLGSRPREAVLFAQLTLKDIRYAWELAHSLSLSDDRAWSDLVTAYEKVDPLAVLPVHRELVETQLIEASAQNYRLAARRLATMRKLAAGTDQAAEVDDFIVELREAHTRRSRLQQEFDRARLP